MAMRNFDDLIKHNGHDVAVVTYRDETGEPMNVAVECADCYEVLFDFEKNGDN